jgi:hypothetical protein
MRKFILTAISALAITGAVAGTASANVAVDNGVGHVDKGDVQRVLGWNNADFDKGVSTLKFEITGTQTQGNETRWQCSDGIQSRTSLVKQANVGKANVTTLKSSNGKQITGWDLNGATAGATGGAFLGGKYVGAPYVGYCPAGGFSGFLDNVFTTTYDFSGSSLTVNGVAVPNTPVEVAPVVPAA